MTKKTLLALFLMITVFIVIINCTDDKTVNTETTAKDDSLQESIARGDYLVNNVAGCLDCHSHRDFKYFAGPKIPGTEGMGGQVFDNKLMIGIPGILYSKNITPDTATGIGNWTDEELFRAITMGINKKGDTLFPLMPYPAYNHLPKQDILDIIAYVRTLKPINNPVPARKLFIPISTAYPPNLQPNTDKNVRPAETDKVKYGEYLVMIAECHVCHTPMNERGQQGEPFTGGLTFTTPAFKVTSANITPDSLTGIGAWTEQMFLEKFKTYRKEEGYKYDPGRQNTIMPWTFFANMTDDDLKAIYAYLRTLKPVKNKIEKWAVQDTTKKTM
ncbi:MAG TPA: c-type cytochrome [Chitinophagaceae bacterium]|nr:c-type cytochrome [Chitinophagaceae bacterium]